MRTIAAHKLTGLNDALEITVLDEPGRGGACHEYQIEWGNNDGGDRTGHSEPRRKWKLIEREEACRLRDKEAKAKEGNRAVFDYQYEMHTGEVQEVKATLEVSRTIHRWKWTPFHRVRDSIWVTFSDEVGPGRGSWKGGVTGCGYTIRKGELPIQCLRRMERERRFER